MRRWITASNTGLFNRQSSGMMLFWTSAEKKSNSAPLAEKRADGHALYLIERINTILCIEKGYSPPKHRVPARWKKYLLRLFALHRHLCKDVFLCPQFCWYVLGRLMSYKQNKKHLSPPTRENLSNNRNASSYICAILEHKRKRDWFWAKEKKVCREDKYTEIIFSFFFYKMHLSVIHCFTTSSVTAFLLT